MSTRAWITALLIMMIGSVLFGIGITIVLTAKSLAKHAATLIPVVIGLSILISPVIAWYMAPILRLRHYSSDHRRDR
ncbi:MAG: hypothetical protein R3D67_02085 [Hyphomicrobiaceae bacterium]